jgi:hypothetical protein
MSSHSTRSPCAPRGAGAALGRTMLDPTHLDVEDGRSHYKNDQLTPATAATNASPEGRSVRGRQAQACAPGTESEDQTSLHFSKMVLRVISCIHWLGPAPKRRLTAPSHHVHLSHPTHPDGREPHSSGQWLGPINVSERLRASVLGPDEHPISTRFGSTACRSEGMQRNRTARPS